MDDSRAALRIFEDLLAHHGLIAESVTPVSGGLLNRKWRVSTARGDVLVKQYSMRRFDRRGIERIERRLSRQEALAACGVPCPRLWRRGGRIIRWVDRETAYLVMDFYAGHVADADSVTAAQMKCLGDACARMHGAFASLPRASDARLPAFGGYTHRALREYCDARTAELPPDAPEEYRGALRAAGEIAARLPADFFDRFATDFAHEDFHSGNLLFYNDGLSAIVDFDRNCHSYPLRDVGRALLSFALSGGGICIEKVRAFREGYARHTALSAAALADAMRLALLIEIPWWIQPQFFGACDATPRRFREEMCWLIGHFWDLEDMLRTV